MEHATWTLDPSDGFDRLALGTPRTDLVATYGEPGRVFRRAGTGPEVLFFVDAGLQASVEDGRVTFVEVTDPARVVVAGISLLGATIAEARRSLAEAGAPLHATGDPVVWEWEGSRAGVFLDGGEQGDEIAAVSFGAR